MGTLAKDSKAGVDRALWQFRERIYTHPLAVRLGPANVTLGLSVVTMAVIVAISIAAKVVFKALF